MVARNNYSSRAANTEPRLPDVWVRLAGAVVAASLASIAAAASFWLNLYWWSFGLGFLAVLGIGVAAVLGFLAAPRAIRTPHPVWLAIGLALQAVLIGFAVLFIATLVTAAWPGFGMPGSSLADMVFFGIAGLPAALVLGMPVTMPVALAGVAVLRLMARRPPIGGLIVVGGVCAAALSAGLATSLPRPNLAFDEAPSPVILSWTVVNHSSQPLEVGIFEHETDGFGGSTVGIEPCFTTAGRQGVGADWFLTLDPESPTMSPPELVSAGQAPGTDVSVWVEIASDGSASVQVGRSTPAPRELTVDHCLVEGVR